MQVVPPPPIQGIGMSGGFQMQVELTDGTFDYRKLQRISDLLVSEGNTQSGLERVMTTFRADVPQISAEINRSTAQSLNVPIGSIFDTLQSYLGSTYANQIQKFGRVFPVFVQADSDFRLTPQDLRRYYVRSSSGDMVPIGTLADVEYTQGPALISMYNLYPSSSIIGMTASGFSSGQSLQTMDQLVSRTLPPGTGSEWTAMSYQEKLAGRSAYLIFGLALLLVYLVLAGQYGSWVTPAAVILGVPLALLGTAGALLAIGIANNLYTQIGLVLLIALSAKNAILIVEVALELRAQGQSIHDAAVEAARKRFRPIIMTSFAFILGVVPLVLAKGAGAAARASIGIAVFSGMLASTCLAVLFVPSFFVILQRWQERNRKPGTLQPPRRPARPGAGAFSARTAPAWQPIRPGLEIEIRHGAGIPRAVGAGYAGGGSSEAPRGFTHSANFAYGFTTAISRRATGECGLRAGSSTSPQLGASGGAPAAAARTPAAMSGCLPLTTGRLHTPATLPLHARALHPGVAFLHNPPWNSTGTVARETAWQPPLHTLRRPALTRALMGPWRQGAADVFPGTGS